VDFFVRREEINHFLVIDFLTRREEINHFLVIDFLTRREKVHYINLLSGNGLFLLAEKKLIISL